MYIHLGGDVVIQAKDIVAILDYSHQEIDKKSIPFLEDHEKNGSITWITKEATKSIVVTEDHIYGSPISSLTLNRRAFEETYGY